MALRGPVEYGVRSPEEGIGERLLLLLLCVAAVFAALFLLAPLLVESLTEILGSINKSGTSILLVEQTLDVALSLAHRLYVMDQGQVQFTGTPDELRRNPAVQQRFLGV